MNNLIIQNNELQVLQTIAVTAAKSGLYGGVGGTEKILMILLAAQDLGIKPTIALNGGIWNIQGKIEISARLMTSMIRRAGHSIKIKVCDDKICTLIGKRADGSNDEVEVSFSLEDATKAGLAGRDVWKKYAQDMLYARAMSRLARRLFPDVIGNAYVEGEIRDAQPLEQAECEVSDCPTEEPSNEVPVIGAGDPLAANLVIEPKSPQIEHELARQLMNLSKRCDPEYVGKVVEYLKTKGIDGFINVTEKEYNKVKIGLEKNSELFKKPEV